MNQFIQLRTNNPYSIGNIFVFDEGDYVLDRNPINVEKSVGDQYYDVVDGDNLSTIAFNFYGNSKWWWIISDVNEIYWPFELITGTTLLIPDINKVNILI